MKRQQGFSLIELMVALLIGLLLLGAMLNAFLSSKVTYSTQSALAKVQENARFAMEIVGREVRQAGYQGCSVNNSFANTVNTGASYDDFFSLDEPVDGLNNVTGATYGSNAGVDNSDVLMIKYASLDGGCTVDSHNPTAASIHCQGDNTTTRGQILMISDCQHSAVFQESAVVGNPNNPVVHNTGGSAVPGNCTKGLGLPVDCTSTNGTPYTFPPGSSVMSIRSFRFFLAVNDQGEPALYQQALGVNSGTSTVQIDQEELVEGIEDMQILYGQDTDGDNSVNSYVPSDAVGDMEDVIAVRVSMLIRSIEDNVLPEAQTYTFNDATVTASDRRIRKVFTSTFAVRNRL